MTTGRINQVTGARDGTERTLGGGRRLAEPSALFGEGCRRPANRTPERLQTDSTAVADGPTDVGEHATHERAVSLETTTPPGSRTSPPVGREDGRRLTPAAIPECTQGARDRGTRTTDRTAPPRTGPRRPCIQKETPQSGGRSSERTLERWPSGQPPNDRPHSTNWPAAKIAGTMQPRLQWPRATRPHSPTAAVNPQTQRSTADLELQVPPTDNTANTAGLDCERTEVGPTRSSHIPPPPKVVWQ